MGIKSLGYVRIATTKAQAWDHFMMRVVGVMRGESPAQGVATYRIDDRSFRFWVEEGDTDRLLAAGYDVG
ncbi:MAG: glyoxalase, partial [Novosphingobium sp. 35-62-5]